MDSSGDDESEPDDHGSDHNPEGGVLIVLDLFADREGRELRDQEERDTKNEQADEDEHQRLNGNLSDVPEIHTCLYEGTPSPYGTHRTAQKENLMIALLTALFALLLSADAHASDKVHRASLANGMRAVVVERPNMRATVVTAAYRAGRREEISGRAGVAAVTQRLTEGGAGKSLAARQRLTRHGASLSSRLSSDLATYITQVDAQHLPVALWLEALRMAVFDPSEASFASARAAEVADGLALRRQSTEHMATRALFALSLGHSFPKGTLAHLELDHAKQFHARLYTPDRAVLVVVGPTPAEQVLQLLDKTVGRVTRRSSAVAAAPLLAQQSRRHTSVQSRFRQRAAVAYGWNLGTLSPSEAATMDVVAEMLAGGRTSAIFHELATKRGSAFAANAARRGELLIAFVEGHRQVKPIDLATVVQQLATRLGVSTSAVNAAKKRLLRRSRLRRADPRRVGLWLARLSAFDDGSQTIDATLRNIEAVSEEDVKRLARERLRDERASVVEVFPAKIFLNKADEAARQAKLEKAREEAEKAKKKKRRRRPKPKPKARGKTKAKGKTKSRGKRKKKPPASKKKGKKKRR